MKRILLTALLIITVICTVTSCGEPISAETETTETEAPQTVTQAASEAETQATSAQGYHYFQFPLTSPTDTTSHVSIIDSEDGKQKTVEFLVLPENSDNPELTSSFKFTIPTNGEANIQIVSYKTETDYGFIYLYERVHINDPVLSPETTLVILDSYHLTFNTSGLYHFNPEYGTSSCRFHVNDKNMVSVSQYKYNQVCLNRANKLIENYSNFNPCEFTILYRYVDGEETVNTPTEAVPVFPFTIFNTYNQPDLEE
jgi:hypothetical protein